MDSQHLSPDDLKRVFDTLVEIIQSKDTSMEQRKLAQEVFDLMQEGLTKLKSAAYESEHFGMTPDTQMLIFEGTGALRRAHVLIRTL